jgi:hypothetical protein
MRVACQQRCPPRDNRANEVIVAGIGVDMFARDSQSPVDRERSSKEAEPDAREFQL